MKSIVNIVDLIRSAAAKFSFPRLSRVSSSSHPAKTSALAVTALLALGAIFSATSASAANLRLYVNISGYGQVRVLDGSKTGGRVVWHQSGNYFYTDRVARGEVLIIEATPDTRMYDYKGDCAVIGYARDDKNPKYASSKPGELSFQYAVTIPQDSGFSNMNAVCHVDWSDQKISMPIPIGSR